MVFQWFPMVANHWSDDGMVTIHRSGLGGDHDGGGDEDVSDGNLSSAVVCCLPYLILDIHDHDDISAQAEHKKIREGKCSITRYQDAALLFVVLDLLF